MKRFSSYKKRKFMYITLSLIFISFIGIGYSTLSQELTAQSIITYEPPPYIGFREAHDNGGTKKSTNTISEDRKTITFNCNFGSDTSQDSCIVKATIINTTDPDKILTENPIITYDNTYINTLTLKWNNHPTYEYHTVYQDNYIAKGTSQEVILTVKTKFFDEKTTLPNNLTIPITVTLNFEDSQTSNMPTKENLAILKATSDKDESAFRSTTYKEKIKNIYFEKGINIPTTATESWDISKNSNGTVMAYVVPNKTDSAYYDLYIQSNTQLYANENMSYYFYDMHYVESINNLKLMDTSMTTNMYKMFGEVASKSTSLILDVSSFDTSEVTNMNGMFRSILQGGYSLIENTTLTLDLSNFDTSNVTDTSFMFWYASYGIANVTIDVSNFDMSNVTIMEAMFGSTGSKSVSLNIKLGSFYPKKPCNMSRLFSNTGYNSTNFTLDVSNFNTSNVTNMSSMFAFAGYSNPNFTLDVSDFDTSKVTNMKEMFKNTGYTSTNFTLDLSNFDTRNVTNMQSMFWGAGYTNPNFNLDISNFDTNNVTDMKRMFQATGYNSSNFTLDLSNFDTSNVTDMQYMFFETAYNSQSFTLDVSKFNTSNVTNMQAMFYNTGYNTPSFTLDVSGFDTSKVKYKESMFKNTGYKSTKLNISITIRNSNCSSYRYMFEGAATQPGSQITVNYTSETSTLVDRMIATKSANSNVVKGSQVT